MTYVIGMATTATSSANSSTVTASFTYGTNLATAEQKVQSAINRISSRLPQNVDPQVLTFSFGDLPVGRHDKAFAIPPDLAERFSDRQSDVPRRALFEQKVDDLSRRSVAEQLAQGLLVPGDAVAFYQGQEVLRSVAAQG